VPYRNKKKPILLHVTLGQRDDSLIFHTKEDKKYFQYHKTSINKSSIQLKCMYATRKNCSAQLSIIANKPNLIQTGEGNQRYRFFMNKNIILDTNSGEDWTVKLDSGKNESRNYYLGKDFKAAAGQVDPKFLIMNETCPDTFKSVPFDYIRLEFQSANMTPIFLDSELSFFKLSRYFC
jgi:hypothetical protein